jgi:hypothetical protein
MDYVSSIFDRLQDCWDPISTEQLAGLQEGLGARLPADFLRFLARFNAGDWAHLVYCQVRKPSPSVDRVFISATNGVVPDDRFSYQDILYKNDCFSDRIPDSFVPIMDALGDLVCIDVGHDFGKVYYCNINQEVNDNNLVYPLADGFDEFLLGLKPNYESDTHYEELPTFRALELGDKEVVLDYLKDQGPVDWRNLKGWTLLMCAARYSWPKIVEILIRAGAEVNARDPDGWTPLAHAVFAGSLDSIKCLLAAGADIHDRDAQGRNLAKFANELHHHRVQYFLERYLNPTGEREPPG